MVLFNLQVFEHVNCHMNAAPQFGDGWEKHFFEQLQVAVVSARQVGRHHCDLVRKSLDQVAFAPDQFPYVRIFLVRHDARSGGQLAG